MSHFNRYGCHINGVLLLDKPQNISSNNALQKIKRIYNANRAGYIGTLDPLATGMLPICFGEATKFSQYLLNSSKRYRVIAKLGQRTDTSDANGKIIQERDISFNKEQLSLALRNFLGKIWQIPSMYSALKYKGKKLYKYARQGIEVPRKPRQINIYELILIRYEKKELELELCCSKGTYIRVIIDDLGEKLGCGAHVLYLRRLAISNYSTERMVKFEYLQSLIEKAQKHRIPKSELLYPLLMPITSLVDEYPVINLPLILSTNFKNGNPVRKTGISLKGLVCITSGKESKFIGMGEINEEGYIKPHRVIVEYPSNNSLYLNL